MKRIILLTFLFFTTKLFCQTDTTKIIEYNDVYKSKIFDKLSLNQQKIKEDTIFDDIFRYDPIFNKEFLFSSMGNIGRPHRKLFLDIPTLEFQFKNFPISAYEYNFKNSYVYNVISPYTRVFYVTGTGRENFFSGVHAQKIKSFSFGIDFRTVTSLGFYRHEKSRNIGGNLYVAYDDENGRYGTLLNLFFNSFKPQENGGILYDTIFTENVEPNRAGVNTKIVDAQNILKKNSIQIMQYWNPFIYHKDSIYQGFNGGTFSYSFTYNRNYHIFSENNPDSLNYQFFLKDTASTYDSVFSLNVKNEIYWSNYSSYLPANLDNYLFFRLGLIHNYIEIKDYILNNHYSQFTTDFNVSYILKKKYIFSYQNNYTLGGYNAQNYLNKLSITAIPFSDTLHTISLNFQNSAINADYFYSYHHGNNFQWDNTNLNPIYNINYSLKYNYKNINFGTTFFNIENYTFITHIFQPLQYSKPIKYWQTFFDAKLKYKIINWHINMTHSTSNNDTLVGIPKFTTRQSIFVRFPMFGRKMIFQTGFDFMYLTDYYAPEYLSALGDFIVQNNNKYGNFYQIDFFIGFKVKKFHTFFKIQNVTEGISPYNYIMMRGYPLPDRLYKLGIMWHFYD